MTMRVLGLLAVAALYPVLTGFVLLSDHKATLPVTPESPTVSFTWDGQAPQISNKEKFLDGKYKDMDDKDAMAGIIADAMALWNAVPGSYITLQAAEGEGAVLDPEDLKFSIVTQHNANASSAAYAVPRWTDKHPETIADCDVLISDRKTEASLLAYTLAHELGHCLGLGHVHTNYNSIMGYSRNAYDFRLGADDKAGAIYLYPDPAQVGKEPKELFCGTAGGNGPASALILLLTLSAPLALAWRRV
jgi:hypothetical protein